jgi:hypothetical protein
VVYQIVTAGANADATVVTPLLVAIPRYAQ